MLQLIVLENQSMLLSLFLIVVQILEFLMIWMDNAILVHVQVSISKIIFYKIYAYVHTYVYTRKFNIGLRVLPNPTTPVSSYSDAL